MPLQNRVSYPALLYVSRIILCSLKGMKGCQTNKYMYLPLNVLADTDERDNVEKSVIESTMLGARYGRKRPAKISNVVPAVYGYLRLNHRSPDARGR